MSTLGKEIIMKDSKEKTKFKDYVKYLKANISNNNKGITLVALVVTIIVLLILARCCTKCST